MLCRKNKQPWKYEWLNILVYYFVSYITLQCGCGVSFLHPTSLSPFKWNNNWIEFKDLFSCYKNSMLKRNRFPWQSQLHKGGFHKQHRKNGKFSIQENRNTFNGFLNFSFHQHHTWAGYTGSSTAHPFLILHQCKVSRYVLQELHDSRADQARAFLNLPPAPPCCQCSLELSHIRQDKP